jgi:hypothetical protein
MNFKSSMIIALFVLVFPYCLSLEGQNKNMEVLRSFPSDEQMDKGQFVLQMPHRFCVNDDSLFICDQGAHRVYKIDLDGKLIKSIGGHGQGPGEFQLPLHVLVYNNRLYIGDNGNARIDIFSLDGVFERSIKIINPLHDFVVVKDHIFDLMFRSVPVAAAEIPIFGIFNMEGDLIKTINERFHSTYKEIKYDNRVRLRTLQNEIHALQMYGTTYRIFSADGEKKKEIELEINPLNDKAYRKLNYLYTYTSFDTFEDRIYASKVTKGRIEINVFDMMGRFLGKNIIQGNPKEIYYVNDMRIMEKSRRRMLYLLMWEPDIRIIVSEIK